MLIKASRFFHAHWPFGLFVFFVLIVLSFADIAPYILAQIFGLAIVLVAAMAWLINDYVKESDDRVKKGLAEISDLLKPYDGMRLSEMPPEVQAEVRKRLGWTATSVNKTPKS